VAFQVSDSQLNATRTARDAGGIYLDDSVEIYIDTRNDRATMMQPDDYQFLESKLNNARVISAAPGPARTRPGTDLAERRPPPGHPQRQHRYRQRH